eukprot:g21767.t1
MDDPYMWQEVAILLAMIGIAVWDQKQKGQEEQERYEKRLRRQAEADGWDEEQQRAYRSRNAAIALSTVHTCLSDKQPCPLQGK